MVYNCSTYFLGDPWRPRTSKHDRHLPARALVDELTSQCRDALERPLDALQLNDINQACYLLGIRTSGSKLPRLFQMFSTLEVLSGKNLVVRAGTGSGKSLAMALPMLLRPNWVFVTIAPLMALQNQHVDTFTRLGIASVALNKETPPMDRPQIMHDILSGRYQHIIISPEQCSRVGNDCPMFTRLLEDQGFVKKIKCLNFDEAHFIVTSGEPDKEGNVFRPEYSKGFEILLRLATGTPCSVFSATMPSSVKNKILMSLRIPTNPSKTRFISLSTNRKNLCFAVKKISGRLADMSNLDFLLPTLCHPPMLAFKKTLIFVPTTTLCLAVEEYLEERLPGAVKRMHSSMSGQYKNETVEEYCRPDGPISLLVATTVLSNGFDPQDIELVIIYGAPKDMLDFEQMAGRGGRDGKTKCLVLLLAESWLYAEGETGLKNRNGSLCSRALRTGNEVFKFVQDDGCRRDHLAKVNEDTTDTALDYEGPFCCDSNAHEIAFNTEYWLPQANDSRSLNPVDLTLDSDSDSDSDLGSEMDVDDSGYTYVQSQGASTANNTVRTLYRPKTEQKDLRELVKAWRTRVHSEDPGASFFPVNDILSSKLIPKLVRLRNDAPELSTPASLTKFVRRSEEWMCLYAHSLHSLLADYSSTATAPRSKPGRKSRVDRPELQYMGVLKVTKNNTKGKGRQTKALLTPSQPSVSQASTSTAATTTATTASTSQKRALPESQEKNKRKRVKREPLNDVSLNYTLN